MRISPGRVLKAVGALVALTLLSACAYDGYGYGYGYGSGNYGYGGGYGYSGYGSGYGYSRGYGQRYYAPRAYPRSNYSRPHSWRGQRYR